MNCQLLLSKVKQNLIIGNDEDDALINDLIIAATSYAEDYQHLESGYYKTNPMSPITERGIIMLASHMYESRDGSTGGFFADSVAAAKQSWETVNNLLRLGRDWQV